MTIFEIKTDEGLDINSFFESDEDVYKIENDKTFYLMYHSDEQNIFHISLENIVNELDIF